MKGHITIGRMTIYGRNAMHFGVDIFRKKKNDYVCFRLPLPCFGKWWPLYFYVSPDGTPNAATYALDKATQNAMLISAEERAFKRIYGSAKTCSDTLTIPTEEIEDYCRENNVSNEAAIRKLITTNDNKRALAKAIAKDSRIHINNIEVIGEYTRITYCLKIIAL